MGSCPLAFPTRHHDVRILGPTLILVFTLLSSEHSPTRDHQPILYDKTTSARVRGGLQFTVPDFTAAASTCSNGGRSKRNIFGGITTTPPDNVKYAKSHGPNDGYNHRTCVAARVIRGGRWFSMASLRQALPKDKEYCFRQAIQCTICLNSRHSVVDCNMRIHCPICHS